MYTVVCSELLEKDAIGIKRGVGDDSDVLQTHGVWGRLDMV